MNEVMICFLNNKNFKWINMEEAQKQFKKLGFSKKLKVHENFFVFNNENNESISMDEDGTFHISTYAEVVNDNYISKVIARGRSILFRLNSFYKGLLDDNLFQIYCNKDIVKIGLKEIDDYKVRIIDLKDEEGFCSINLRKNCFADLEKN